LAGVVVGAGSSRAAGAGVACPRTRGRWVVCTAGTVYVLHMVEVSPNNTNTV
jgi:hypothetical protein